MKASDQNTCSALSDEKLWQEFKLGSSVAFAEIYRRYMQVLYNYGFKVTSNDKLIEDCIQDLFIYLWKNHTTLGNTDSIKFYLFRSLRRSITRKLNRQGGWLHESVDELDRHLAAEPVFSHETYLIDAQTEIEKVAALRKSLEKLTPRQREAITLRFYENFSYEEISEIMSLNYKSVCNLVYKSLSTLRENMPIGLFTLIFGLFHP